MSNVGKYELHTESGNIYYIDTDKGLWTTKSDPYPEKIWQFKVVEPEEFEPIISDEGPWRFITSMEETLGMRIYISGRNSWRISTIITEVKLVDSFPEL